jgi:NTE family protein
VDGGVTDNLGLRAILASVSLIGVQEKYDILFKDKEPPKQLVIIVVNASTDTKSDIGETRTLPSMGETMSAVTDMQLHLYNTETSSVLKDKLMQWEKTVSTKEHPLTPYFINLDVTGIQDPQYRHFFNGYVCRTGNGTQGPVFMQFGSVSQWLTLSPDADMSQMKITSSGGVIYIFIPRRR